VKSLYAKINLALALIVHLCFKRWFQKRGLAQFLADYKEDHIFPLALQDRTHWVKYSNCVFCGLCVSQCEMAQKDFYQKFMIPAILAFSYTRSLPEISLNGDFTAYGEEGCLEGEKVCPTGVPLTQIMKFTKSHAN